MKCQCKIEWNCLYFAERTNPGCELLVFFSLLHSVLFLLAAAVCLPWCDTQVSSAL